MGVENRRSSIPAEVGIRFCLQIITFYYHHMKNVVIDVSQLMMRRLNIVHGANANQPCSHDDSENIVVLSVETQTNSGARY